MNARPGVQPNEVEPALDLPFLRPHATSRDAHVRTSRRLEGVAADDDQLVAAFAALLCRYAGATRLSLDRRDGGSCATLTLDLGDDPSLATLAARIAAAPRDAASRATIAFDADAADDAFSRGYDLVLRVERDTAGLTLALETARNGVDDGAPARLLGNLDVLLRGALSSPGLPLRALDLLTDAERTTMLVAWNATRAPFDDVPFHELFEACAAREPQRVAAIAGGDTLTYGELDRRANRLAHELIARGVGPDVPVGIALERGFAMLVAVFAVLKAGGAYIPLDPSNPPQRQALILADAAPAVLLTQTSLAGDFAALGERVVALDRLDLRARSEQNPGRRTGTGNIAYIVYTSGSTGRPKGVVIEHRSVAAFLGWVRRAFDDAELGGVLFATSLAFDVSVFEIFGPLSFGGRIIVVDNILALHDAPAKDAVTLIAATASGFAALLRGGPLPASVATVMQAGERLHGATAAALQRQPGMRRVLNLCGGTEDTVYSVVYDVPADVHENPPIGRPFDNHEVYLLDERMQPVPVGVPGEIYYAGLGVAREYLNRPELSAKSFVANPFATSPYRRLYRSGDIACYRADGNLEYLHRADTQIKLRGFRVELAEIEQILLAHPDVAEAVVVAVPHESDDVRLAAYVVGRAGAPPLADLRAFATGRLPSYMVPAAFVALERLPQDPNGKLDRSALPPAPFGTRDSGTALVAPTTPLEVELVALFGEFLGVDAVGIEDDFFELGGHSLMASRIVARLRDRYPAITLRAFIEDRTIAALAARSAAVAATNGVAHRPASTPAGGEWPLSYAQTAAWERAVAGDGSTTFNIAAGWTLSGPLDRGALAQALDGLIARHPQLRARIVRHDGGPRIRFAAAPSLALQTEIVAGGADALAAALAREARRPFDVDGGPLVRASLFESKGEPPVLLLTAHELISDPWNAPLLTADLAALYGAAHRDDDAHLPPLDYQYQEYALAERDGGESGLYDDDIAYWSAALRGARTVAAPGGAAPRSVSPQAEQVRCTLDGAALERLRAFVRQRGTTTYAVLAAAFATLIARTTGRTDVVFGAPFAGRHYCELEKLVGNFASLRPVQVDLAGDPPFAEAVARTAAAVAAANAHQATPLAVLRDRLAAQRPDADALLFGFGVRMCDPAPVLEAGGIGFAPRPVAAGSSHFAQLLDATEHDDRLDLAFTYRIDGLSEADARAQLDAYVQLLAAATAQPALALETNAYPLSHAQEQLWFLDGVLVDRAVYNVPMAWRVHGPLDVAALQTALDGLIARHEQLRASFTMSDGRPLQRIAASSSLPLRHEPVDDAAALDAALTREGARAFDLSAGPLVRAVLFEPAGSDPVLLLTFHHIVCDGWSVNIVAEDLAALYAAAQDRTPPNLRPLPARYTEYALAERTRAESGAYEPDVAYWTARLAELSRLDLIGDRRASRPRSAAGGQTTQRISGAPLDLLRRCARRAKTTTYGALLAAFAAFLTRQNGATDIAIGSPVSGRRDPALEPVVGYFISMLTMRIDTSGDPTFAELAARAQTTASDAFDHQAAPFTLLVERIAPHRDEMNSPLFSVAFVKQAPVPAVRAGGVSFAYVNVPTGLAKFDLLLEVTEETDELVCTFNYAHDTFGDAFAASLLDTFCRLVTLAAERPDVPFGALPLLASQREAALSAPPAALIGARPEVPVHERFAEHVRRTPDAPAVVDGTIHRTYAQLDRAAERLAARLRANGVGPGSFVGLCLARSVHVVESVIAILRCGAAYVPLDPLNPPERLAFIAADAGTNVVVTDRAWAASLPASVVRIDVDADGAEGAGAHETAGERGAGGAGLTAHAGPDDAAYVIYTSGSTGTPKGVVVTHRNVARLFDAANARFTFGADDVWTLFHSYAFDFSVWEMWGALSYGGQLVVVPPDVARAPADFRRLCAERRVTVLNQTPSAFYEFVAADARDATPLRLRYVIFGGEALDPRRLAPWFARHGETTPSLVNMYGITETTVHVTHRPLTAADAAAPLSPIGTALPDLQLLLLDAHGNLVPDGFPGEIVVGGDGVARGYLGRPDLTAERFPERGGQRVYRSGDLARRRLDGEYEYVGRSDQQVQVRGYRVELGEIEAALVAQSTVERAIVIDEPDGAGDTRLVAFVVARDGMSPGDLRAALSAKLPAYMIPSAIVPIQAIPLTTNGKLDRHALAALPRTGVAPAAADEPVTPLEARVARIFCDFLKLDAIGLDDSFFMRGGHSLLAARLAARVEREIPGATERLRDADGKSRLLRLFYSAPTVRALAALLQGETVLEGSLPLICMQPGDPSRPAMFWLHGMFNGDGLYAWELVKALPDDVPFYVLHPHGYDGRPFPADMMQLASEQLAWIRSVRPHGPYHLGGFCNGALVAFEIASRLVHDGEDVRSLTLVSIPPVLPVGPQLMQLAQVAGKLLGLNADQRSRLHLYLRSYSSRMMRVLRVKGRRRILAAGARKAARKLGRIARREPSPTVFTPNDFRDPQFKNEHYIRAISEYQPSRYPGTADIVWGREIFANLPDSTSGWGASVGDARVYVLEGGHESLAAEHGDQLGALLREIVERSPGAP